MPPIDAAKLPLGQGIFGLRFVVNLMLLVFTPTLLILLSCPASSYLKLFPEQIERQCPPAVGDLREKPPDWVRTGHLGLRPNTNYSGELIDFE